MAKLTLDGREIEALEGAPLVEVIKSSGTFISNLCYIDGRPPYAGCRTCLVEIEGARGLQLSCTTKASAGMVVNTDTPVVKQARQATLSLILSYHSDRCLTCHRDVKCKPGDTCLRDDVVTHRCLTCSKNYRCELQTTCEMLEMAGYEPWEGEERTYYQTSQPEPDKANPFLEFDPQMCIICTRCVRTCDEIRHTGAIALSGRGYETRIEFGAGGPVHESNCDFCGSCIDQCPTAALMEHPNKWSATQTEKWTPTTCVQCSVGCSISLGAKKGRGVIVRPDSHGNPVSNDQLCVRGRFHYDAIKPSARLSLPLVRRDGGLETATWQEAIGTATESLARIRGEHGADAIAFLGSPLATNEENYLLQKLARAVAGTNNVDSSAGPVAAAVSSALRGAFGSEILPGNLQELARSRTIVVVADDLESSHNIAALRIKDAVTQEGARLIVVSARQGELCAFAEVWLQPRAGEEIATLAAITRSIAEAGGNAASTQLTQSPAPKDQATPAARDILLEAIAQESRRPISFVYAMPHLGASQAAETCSALANLAIACLGPEAASTFFALPQEANIWGMRDVGATPDMLPGYRPVERAEERREVETAWGAHLPSTAGMGLREMLEHCGGRVRALVVLADNPLLLAADKSSIQAALSRLDLLLVIDTIMTDTARLAHVVLPDSGPYAKDGTTTSADRRILRLQTATSAAAEAQPAWRILGELGQALIQRLHGAEVRINYPGPAEIMDEIARLVPLYQAARYQELDNGSQQHINGMGPRSANLQQVIVTPTIVSPAISTDGSFVLATGRSLYISYEGAAIHSADADKLHRDEFLEIHPDDAERLKIVAGDSVTVANILGSLTVPAKLTAAVQPGLVYLPLYYEGGSVTALFEADQPYASVQVSRAETSV